MRTTRPDHAERLRRAHLSLEGLSIGDAFGQRFFGDPRMSLAMIAARALPAPPWHYTDDTEMALAIVEVLDAAGGAEQDRLAQRFGARYARDPWRGYGGTAHEILRSICDGVPWAQAAGVVFSGMGSMGNGAAMRVAPLGAYFADDLDAVVAEARASAAVTHAHPDGQAGAIAVAVAAAGAVRLRGAADLGPRLLDLAIAHTPDGETREGLLRARALPPGCSVALALAALGNGSRVISADTVPFCLWCVAQGVDSYEEALWRTVEGLGDRDTTCAIVGGIVALVTGEEGLPAEWRSAREPLALGA